MPTGTQMQVKIWNENERIKLPKIDMNTLTHFRNSFQHIRYQSE